MPAHAGATVGVRSVGPVRRLLALLLLVLPACGGAEDEVPAAAPEERPAPSGDLVLTVERSRLFEQQRSLAVSLENRGAATVTVVDPQLDSGRHDVVDAPPRTVTLDPGRLLTFPLPYGPARCGDVGEVVAVRAEVDGSVLRLEAPVTDRIVAAHERECDGQRARAAVDLAFADDWTAQGTVASGTLTVRPKEPDVRVVEVRTAIVFVASASTPLPTDGDVALELTAGRCDVHALIESKKTFTVAVHVQVGDDDPVPVEIVADDGPVRSALDAAIGSCVAEAAGT